MILIAAWAELEDASLPPSTVYWANGVPAKREDYWHHLKHTSITLVSPGGCTLQLFLPGLFGTTFFDTVDHVWKVRPEGEVLSLFANDPLAKDDVIVEELTLSPIAYMPKIVRGVTAENRGS